MAIVSTRVWCMAFVILLTWTPRTESRNVTHEDIREAIMSLVHMFRTSEDKLERHEYREKALGDQLKRMIGGLEKKHRALEPLKGMILRLDERIYNIENIFLQKEEREKTSQKKTNEALEEIQKSLQSLTSSIMKKSKPAADVETNLTTDEDSVSKRLDSTDAKLDAVKMEIENLKNSLSKDALRAMCLEVASDVNPLERHITEAEKLLSKYDMKLNEYTGNTSKVQTDVVLLNEISMADEAWHNKMTEVMERQEKSIKKIEQLLSDAESMWKDLPRLADLSRASNHTLEAVAQMQDTLQTNLTDLEDSTVSKIANKLREMSDRMVATNKDIQETLTQGNTMSEIAYKDILRSYDSLRTEQARLVSKNENVMLQTADDVMANKKRIEYGVQQILMEVGELVRKQGGYLNKSMTERFDLLESKILTNQSMAFSNLSASMESEMTHVWRQIGVMYQQLIASKGSLDKLTEQTALYVNSSNATLEGMKDKVGLITKRMLEVDDNLNYLLGRLSLVTQEFSHIKTGLGEALDKAKQNLSQVQDKVEDAGPGPHSTT